LNKTNRIESLWCEKSKALGATIRNLEKHGTVHFVGLNDRWSFAEIPSQGQTTEHGKVASELKRHEFGFGPINSKLLEREITTLQRRDLFSANS